MVMEVFLDQQSLGIKPNLKEAGIVVHDDSEIRGSTDTSIGIPDQEILGYLATHRELRLVTKDRRLGKEAVESGLDIVYIDESDVVAAEAIKRLVLNKAEVKRRFGAALERFLHHDSVLLAVDANERSMTHKIAEYLQDEFKDWNVDCEYNRVRADPKKVELPRDGISWDDVEGRTVFPDIIVHQRTTASNLLVIEVKKSTSNVSDTLDKEKLRQFRSDPYFYGFRVFLRLYAGDKAAQPPESEWI